MSSTNHQTEIDEDEFRRYFEVVQRRSCQCLNIMSDTPCRNTCHYLIGGDGDNLDKPTVRGIDCVAWVSYWDGNDVEDTEVEAYCNGCAEAQRRYLLERESKKAIETQRLRETEQQRISDEGREKRTQREFWLTLSDLEFEKQCIKLFEDLGFSATKTPLTNDGGFDILLEKDGSFGAAQCKAWVEPCGVKPLREFYGALHAKGKTFGFFIARSSITKSAASELAMMQKIPSVQCWSLGDLLKQALQVRYERPAN
jgi:hypothetical protein